MAAGLLVLVVLAGAARWWTTSTRTSDGPIIFISIDTLRADHLPIYGYGGVKTPASRSRSGAM